MFTLIKNTLFLFTLFTSIFAYADRGKEPLPQTLPSRKVFRDLISSNPMVNSLYQALQHNQLADSVQMELSSFLMQNPSALQIYFSYLQNYDKFLETEEIKNKGRYLILTSHTSPRFKIIDKLIVNTMTDLGFSEEAIKNHKAYVVADQDINAFTVSGSAKKTFIFINKGLLNAFSRSETDYSYSQMRAILAHELGHVLNHHVILGRVIGHLNDFLVEQLTDPNDVLKMQNSMLEQQGPGSELSKSSWYHQEPNSLILLDQMAFSIKQYLRGLNQPDKNKLTTDYLTLLSKASKKAELSKAFTTYFSKLHEHSQNGAPLAVGFSQLLNNLTEISLAFSRSFEITSDRISASVARNEDVALTLIGLGGEGVKEGSAKKILDQYRLQAQEFLEQIQNDEFRSSKYLGSTHPFIIPRIHNALSIDTIPFIYFAHPFLRLVHLSVESENILTLPENKESHAQIFNVINQVNTEILKLIVDFGITRRKNPRLDNLIDYMLVRRQLQILNKSTQQQSTYLSSLVLKELVDELKLLENTSEDKIDNSSLQFRQRALSASINSVDFNELQEQRDIIYKLSGRGSEKNRIQRSWIPDVQSRPLRCDKIF